MGYGAMRITGPQIWGMPENPQNSIDVLQRAVELGVNFIDTADQYGPFTSEELIGEALHPYQDDVIIGTKGGLVRFGPWADINNDASPQHLQDALDGSLRRLKLHRIELYQLHRIDPARRRASAASGQRCTGPGTDRIGPAGAAGAAVPSAAPGG